MFQEGGAGLLRVERGYEGDAEERAGGGSQGFRVVGAGGAFEEEDAGKFSAFGGSFDHPTPALPGSWRASRTTTRLVPWKICSRVQTAGRTRAMTPCGVSVEAIDWNSASGIAMMRVSLRCGSFVMADSAARTVGTSRRLRRASSRRWKPSAIERPSSVRSLREMARRTSRSSGLAALVIV